MPLHAPVSSDPTVAATGNWANYGIHVGMVNYEPKPPNEANKKKTNSKSNNAFELLWAVLNLQFSPTSTVLSEQSQKKGIK